MSAITRSQKTNQEITALLQARNALLWIVTREEVRVERAITEAAAAARYPVATWDCDQGIQINGQTTRSGSQDPQVALAYLRDSRERRVLIMRDLHQWMDPITRRRIRNLARTLPSSTRDEARALIVLSPSAEVPPELAGHAVVIEYPLPERAEISRILASAVEARPDALPEDLREAAVDAAVGLTAEEAASCYARSLVTLRRIDPALVAADKRRVVRGVAGIDWHDPDPRGLDAIGGLDRLKIEIMQRRASLGQEARAYGLPAPRGLLVAGVSGCGKSLTAKAVAAAWGLPLLRFDLGGLKSKYVGESEGNIRKALAIVETIGSCVLWLDEIEKALAGSSGPQGDGGVATDQLGTLLTWLQERAGGAYVVATCNDASGLRPELLRRFDACYFVDLPNSIERRQIVEATLAKHRQSLTADECIAIACATQGYTGAEISDCIPSGMFRSFADGARPLAVADVLAAATEVVPLAKTAAETIQGLREWSQGRARPASTPEATTPGQDRLLDLDPDGINEFQPGNN